MLTGPKQCPKCGFEFAPGTTKCARCGYLYVVGGPKPKRKARRWREPGSTSPVLGFFFIAGLVGYGYTARPWLNDFEDIKALFGVPRKFRLNGDWGIAKVVHGSGPSAVATNTTQGTFQFKPKDQFGLNLVAANVPIEAKGKYFYKPNTLKLAGIRDTPTDALPETMQFKLTRISNTRVIASLPNKTAVYLRKLEGKERIANVVGYKLAGTVLRPLTGAEIGDPE
ncbi:MAG: hypothetical protein SFX74_12125 [Fimbriimonadaceae bacterium]|nr:hypothetical protein [Fimbriimonadaceae bacterium]